MMSVRSILAIAVGFLSTLPACAAVSTLQLQSPPPVGKKAVAMPLIANPSDDAERRINVALKRLDANLRKAIRDGKGNDNGPGGWVRKVEPTMKGPGYLSFVITDTSFCGGPYPSIGTMSIVYDLRTGTPVDWAQLLPPLLTGQIALTVETDGTRMATLERFSARLNCAVFPTRWKCDSWGAPNRRRRGMGPLSVDLRKRVVSAVREEGMSCRAAAQRFGVSFSSAICWVAALRERGSYAPLPMGGDTRSQRVEAHTDFLLRLHRREPDLTLNEICDRLERARGEKVSPSMIWRFFDRHDITFKKSPRTRVSRAARTSLSGDGDGSTVNSISIR